VWAIVVAGGSGRRFGGPKQFLQLAGRPVAAWSVDAARSVADGVVLVVPEGTALPGDRGGPDSFGADRVVTGGESRADSVRAGLGSVPDDAAVIVVHDAARPLAGPSLFSAVVEAVSDGAPCAIPVLPVADTLKRASEGLIRSTVDREGLVTVQTPQAFAASTLRKAHGLGGQSTDDAGLVEQMGVAVHTVPGDPRNLKITRPEDLGVAEALMAGVAG
jgi:2-C-methyl-D-erythritol 4-phosphate cytidylyltransferase